MTAKPFYVSKQAMYNLILTLSAIAALSQFAEAVPSTVVKWVALVGPIGNILLRIWFPEQAELTLTPRGAAARNAGLAVLLGSVLMLSGCAKGNLMHLASVANDRFAAGAEKLQLQIDAGHNRTCDLGAADAPGATRPCISDADYKRWRARFDQGGRIGLKFTDALDHADQGGVVNEGTALLDFVQGLLNDDVKTLPPDTQVVVVSVLSGIKTALAAFATPSSTPTPTPQKE